MSSVPSITHGGPRLRRRLARLAGDSLSDGGGAAVLGDVRRLRTTCDSEGDTDIGLQSDSESDSDTQTVTPNATQLTMYGPKKL